MPKYEHPPASFGELIDPLPKEIQIIATRLRKVIKVTLPEADEAISGGSKMGMALYSLNNPNNVVCGFQPTESMCKLFFHSWEELANRGYKLEGSGKNARHLKLRTGSDFHQNTIEEMLLIVKEIVKESH